MHPRLSEYPHISSYPVLLLIGYFLAYLLARSRARRAGIEPRHVDNLGLMLLLTGLAGARLFSRAFEMPSVHGLDVLKLWEGGGLVFYGGLIVSATVLVAYALAARLPLLKTLDAFAPAALIGLGIGRIGCFLAGCCWGDVCVDRALVEARVSDPAKIYQVQTFPALSREGFFMAVRFPERADTTRTHKRLGIIPPEAKASAPVHPTQLYEAALALLAGWGVHWATRSDFGRGKAVVLLCGTYAVIRFTLEFLRADTSPAYLGLSLSQVISLLMMGAALALWLSRARAPMLEPAARPSSPRPA